MEQQPNNRDVLLTIENLQVAFDSYHGRVYALSGVDLEIIKGKITGIAGETGCGKSVTAKTVLRLLPKTATVLSGRIEFKNRNLLELTEEQMNEIRGNTISMIFQNPRSALNPLFTIEQQMYFLLHRHQGLDKKESQERTLELLSQVGIAAPNKRLKNYPFELSTGMCQRFMIAMGLACNPRLLIADEPTTGLDVTIQAQVLKLFYDLMHDFDSTAIVITHDLGVIAETCEYLAVMYAGQVVEYGVTDEIIENPLHHYTQGLLASSFSGEEDDMLHYVPGIVPDLRNPPRGCPFAPRCGASTDVCLNQAPVLKDMGNGHMVRCFLE
jgi:peptide/nickel transport system ATP-binding protein